MLLLISDTDFVNFKKHSYDYDTAGNILSETISDIDQNENESNSVTKYYAYGDSNWKDKMTSYNGQSITYDAIGNPLSYRDGITMTWKNGRELASLQNSDNTISYSYGSSGIRVSKTVNGTDYKYAYLNGKLVYETRSTARFFYSYDSSGILYSVKYTLNDSAQVMTYYFTHNSRGDIIGIYNGEGSLKARYEYDAWGNVISITDKNGSAVSGSTHIGNLNPFRYRGYYYDSETGLYYLMSRYYDPVTHRFINADGCFEAGTNILDSNMSAYCGNNPICRIDSMGNEWESDSDEIADILLDLLYAGLAVAIGSKKQASIAAPTYQEVKGCVINDGITSAEYRNLCESNQNCYTYVLGSDFLFANNPGGFSNTSYYNSVETVYRAVNIDMYELGIGCRELSSYDSPILDTEYRVALKVGDYQDYYNCDYHFMVQTNTGQWAEKHGISGDSILHEFGVNPSNIKWTDGKSSKEKYMNGPIYFALRRY